MEWFVEQNLEEAVKLPGLRLGRSTWAFGWDGRAVIIEATPTKASQTDNCE